MHNLLSMAQLNEWKITETQVDDFAVEEQERLNDYYECLIECDDAQAACKRICRRILSDRTLECKLI